MIKWYDVVLAIVFAILIYSFFIYGAFSYSTIEAFLGGAMAGLAYRIWVHEYCEFRKISERKL